jgi:HK97 family phage prohead protease
MVDVRGAAARERREAAQLRAQVAHMGRLSRGVVPGVGAGRAVGLGEGTSITRSAELTELRGRRMYYTTGYYTVFDQPYEMWDVFGPYDERVAAGAGKESLAVGPDTAFLVNHRGLTMARTPGPWNKGLGTMNLREDDQGGWHEAWHNPEREDVRSMISAIDDGLMTEMSFAFMIPDGGGMWSDNFDTFTVLRYDINRGDVSGVNYGASPHTSIAARANEVMQALDRLPGGALREVVRRVERRLDEYEKMMRAVGGPQVTRSAADLAEVVRADPDRDQAIRSAGLALSEAVLAAFAEPSPSGIPTTTKTDITPVPVDNGDGRRSLTHIEALLRTM